MYSAKSFFIALLLAIFVMPPGVAGQKQLPNPPLEQPKKEKSPEVPDLAELIIQGNKLSNRLTVLETKIAHGLDIKALEENLQKILNYNSSLFGVETYTPENQTSRWGNYLSWTSPCSRQSWSFQDATPADTPLAAYQ